MLYICQDLYSFDFETVLPFLPSERRKKAERFRDRTDRANSVFSWLLLIYALFRETGFLPEKDEYFLLAENGKPSFENSPAFFSLSHCRKGIACAATGRKNGEIGVDIQDCRAVSPALLKKVCSKKEQEEIAKSAEPEKEFSRLWTLKESFLKQSGKGVRGDLSKLDFSDTGAFFSRYEKSFHSFVFPDSFLSVCTETPDLQQTQSISAEELLRFAFDRNIKN